MAEQGKGLGNLGILISGFIAVLVVVVLIQSIGNQVEASDVIDTVVNESITITNAAGQTAAIDKVTGVSFFGNATNSTDSNQVTVGTDLNFTRVGVITVGTNITDTVKQTLFGDGNYNITYNVEGAFFVANSTERTLLALVMIFFAIGIIAIAIMIMRKAFPDLF